MTCVPALHAWTDNAQMIAEGVRPLYIGDDDRVLDPTYGLGGWWKRWRPKNLVACDGRFDRSPMRMSIDFTALPAWLGFFDVVAFDPPYKVNGTGDPIIDGRYGVEVKASWQERHRLIKAGITSCINRLNPGGYLLLKCQDQVCSGAKRWQTREFADHAESYSRVVLVDRFDMSGHTRPQPMAGRTQRHAHGHPSSLLVFEKKP